MKPFVRLGWFFGMAMCLGSPGLRGQGYVLNAGDVLVVPFATLPQVGNTPSLFPTLLVDLPFTALPTDRFRIELLEDVISDQPFDDYTVAGVPGMFLNDLQTTFNEPQHPWQDLQGVIRFTGVSGSVGLSQVTIQVYNAPNLYRAVLPVPEPKTGALLLVGLAALGLAGNQRRGPKLGSKLRPTRPRYR